MSDTSNELQISSTPESTPESISLTPDPNNPPQDPNKPLNSDISTPEHQDLNPSPNSTPSDISPSESTIPPPIPINPPQNLPITTQPQGSNGIYWMNPPLATNPDCPPGLEYLTLVDQILVQQTTELFEALTDFETKNRYMIKNTLGQLIYFGVEENDALSRNVLGAIRPFEMRIFDNFQNEIIHISRPLNCQDCCFPCSQQEMEIFSPPGQLIGKVEQEWSVLIPEYKVLDASGNIILRIEGPLIKSGLLNSTPEFKILSLDRETEIGKITKQWGGLLKELYTDADSFGITFPIDLDVKMKATMLGACFLIDMMFYEQN